MELLEDLPGAYAAYLKRFELAVGAIEVGQFAKFSGKLIKKLAFEEFTPSYLDYVDIARQYAESLERGDTINDVVLRLLRDKAAALVLPSPG